MSVCAVIWRKLIGTEVLFLVEFCCLFIYFFSCYCKLVMLICVVELFLGFMIPIVTPNSWLIDWWCNFYRDCVVWYDNVYLFDVVCIVFLYYIWCTYTVCNREIVWLNVVLYAFDRENAFTGICIYGMTCCSLTFCLLLDTWS